MKEPKNLRIVLVPVGLPCDGRIINKLDGEKFKSKGHLQHHLFNEFLKDESKPHDLAIEILTADEFRQFFKSKKLLDSFDGAMMTPKKRRAMAVNEFMSDFNGQLFKGKTEDYWISYVKI